MHDTKTRCGWTQDYGIYTAYHDTEWGVPDGMTGRCLKS